MLKDNGGEIHQGKHVLCLSLSPVAQRYSFGTITDLDQMARLWSNPLNHFYMGKIKAKCCVEKTAVGLTTRIKGECLYLQPSQPVVFQMYFANTKVISNFI